MADQFDQLPINPPAESAAILPPQPQMADMLQPAHEDAVNDFLKEDLNEEKYGGLGQQAITGLEGAAEGVAGPLAPMAEKALGVNPKDILARKETNPITHGVGQAVGLGGSMLLGDDVGLAGAMTKVGDTAKALTGLGEASYGARVGSEAVKQAAEMAILQSSDEVTKNVLGDPSAGAENAIANIGMAAALGGAGGAFMTGAVSPLWKATVGDRLGSFLGDVTSKFGGIEGAGSEVANPLSQRAGIEIPEVLQAKINGTPFAEQAFSKLSQTDTTVGGRSLQKTLNEFNDNVGNKMVETLGHEPSYINKVPDLDKYGTGQKLADTLHDELNERIKPITEAYETTNARFKDSPISPENMRQASDQIAQKSLTEGWHKAESDAQTRLVDRVLEKLPQQETAADLKKFVTNLRDAHPWGSPTYAAARDIRKIIEESQGRAVAEGILSKGGEKGLADKALADYQGLKGQYANLMDTLDNLNEHLHVGKYEGPKSFLMALKDKAGTAGESILSSLAGQNKAGVLEMLTQVSPETLAKVRQYHVDKLLTAAKDGDAIKPAKLLREFDKLSPQLKDLVAGQEGQGRLSALGEVLDKLHDPTHNWSNTARTAAKTVEHAPTALAYLATAMGHGGAALGAHLGKLGLSEGSDILKLGMMKFLGSNQPIKSEGFKAMVEFLHNSVKGENMFAKATSAIFKSGSEVLGKSAIPDSKDREKLDKIVTQLQEHPDKVAQMAGAGHLGHYMPDQQAAATQTTTTALQYLQQLKPRPFQPSPLDRPIDPTPAQTARYNRALDIAQQPLVVMQHIKDGTLQMTDLQDLKAMYPTMYTRIAQKLTSEMIGKHANEEPIPYKTKLGLSLFLGQPLDSSMMPNNIMAAQPMPASQPPQTPSQGAKPTTKASTTMNKNAKSFQTASQQAESDRSSRD